MELKELKERKNIMTIPAILLGLGSLILGLLMTFLFPVQRSPFWNRVVDVFTLVLFVVGAWFVNYWDTWSNLGVGLIAGVVAVVIRDFRLWLTHFKGQVYRATHPYYWYGRAHSWFSGRRRRY